MNLRLATMQRLVILGLILLAVAYLVLFRPLAQRVVEEGQPIQDLREDLARATIEAGLPRGTSFAAVSNRLQVLRASSDALAAAVQESLPRLEQPPEVKRRLEEPFQLVEFLNESQRRLEEIAAQAQAGKVALTPGLPRGFPRYQPELARPELLWVQLAMMSRVVRTAIRSGVREVREVSVEPLALQEVADYDPPLAFSPPVPTRATNEWSALRMHLTLMGSVDALGRLFVALTLTPEELKASGLPEELSGKPALFLDQLLVRRNQLEEAEQIQLEVVVSTMVPNGAP